jgi:hypothetical protein
VGVTFILPSHNKFHDTLGTLGLIHLFNQKILLHFLSVVCGVLPQWQSLLPIRVLYRLVPLLYSVGEIEKFRS